MFAELDAIRDRIKLRQKREPDHKYGSPEGRFLFDLDVMVHSLHAERFEGRLALVLAEDRISPRPQGFGTTTVHTQ